MGAARDTVVIFLSDNGASSEQLIRGDGHDKTAPPGSARTHLGLGPGWSTCSNTPFRLHKSWVNEGGIASPMIVHWPNGIRDQNQLRNDPCHFIDIVPTLVDLAGGSVRDLPGCTLVPAFHKDGAAPRDYLYFNHNNNRAIRVGDSKLIATGKDGQLGVIRSGSRPLRAARPRKRPARRSGEVGRHVAEARRGVCPPPGERSTYCQNSHEKGVAARVRGSRTTTGRGGGSPRRCAERRPATAPTWATRRRDRRAPWSYTKPSRHRSQCGA